jgi:hypothetical protein
MPAKQGNVTGDDSPLEQAQCQQELFLSTPKRGSRIDARVRFPNLQPPL